MSRLRNRERLRRKEAVDLASALESTFGCSVFSPDEPVDRAEADGRSVVLVDGVVVALYWGDSPLLTVRGVLRYGATRRYVTVDMGAVKFVYNGADIMAPGIVEADRSIAVGDGAWVRDERNRQPLAVGEALMTGDSMIAERRGKAVKSIHHVGDDLWKLDEPPS